MKLIKLSNYLISLIHRRKRWGPVPLSRVSLVGLYRSSYSRRCFHEVRFQYGWRIEDVFGTLMYMQSILHRPLITKSVRVNYVTPSNKFGVSLDRIIRHFFLTVRESSKKCNTHEPITFHNFFEMLCGPTRTGSIEYRFSVFIRSACIVVFSLYFHHWVYFLFFVFRSTMVFHVMCSCHLCAWSFLTLRLLILARHVLARSPECNDRPGAFLLDYAEIASARVAA